MTEPVTVIKLDTAAGVITVEAKVKNGVVQEVSFTNAPAFVLREDLIIKTKAFGSLTMDVSWGGNLYAILPAASIGIPICPQNSAKLIEAAQSIAKAVSYTHLDVYKRQVHIQCAARISLCFLSTSQIPHFFKS